MVSKGTSHCFYLLSTLVCLLSRAHFTLLQPNNMYIVPSFLWLHNAYQTFLNDISNYLMRRKISFPQIRSFSATMATLVLWHPQDMACLSKFWMGGKLSINV